MKLLALIWLFVCWPAWGQVSVQNLAVYEDATRQATIASVAALPDEKFSPRPYGLSAGFTRSVHWLRFTAQAPRGEAGEWLLEIHPSFLDDVRLYEPDPASPGGFRERRAGDFQSFSAREVAYRGSIFRVALSDDRPQTFHVRVQSTSTSLAMLKWWQPSQFVASLPAEYAILGAYLGVLAIILVVNALYYLVCREVIYLHYLAYLAASLGFSFFVLGFGTQFLLPDHPALANQLQNYLSFLLFSSGGLLYRTLLRIEREQRVLWILYRVLIFLPLGLMVLLPFGYFTEIQPINIGLLVLMSFVGMGRALYLLRSGEAGSGMLLVATIMSILGVLFANIVFLGISPASFVLLHAWNIGLFGNIIALHLAIGARTQEQERLRHEAEQQARRAEHRATREERARKEHEHFISMVTHELKSPLATIVSAQNSLEILLDKPAPEVETRLERIRRATRRIDTIAERYLREDRQAQPEIHPRFASHALQQVLAMACGHFTGDKARLQVESATDAQLYCDAELLATALLNLMDNAVKYSDGPVSVSASLFQGREVMIDVADRGPGVPDPIRAAIFERYFRAPETADSPGIGLGLSLVKKIVEVHEGTIEVLDREGGGAVFRMVLPICRPER